MSESNVEFIFHDLPKTILIRVETDIFLKGFVANFTNEAVYDHLKDNIILNKNNLHYEFSDHRMILFEKKSNERMYEFDEVFIEN
jgi:hypothetical protein